MLFLFCHQKWQEASNRGAAILSYLGEQVPLIYCLEREPQPGEEEQKVEEHLLYPLECFLFGEDPCVGLEKLQQHNSSSPAQQCGRVFKEGETVYSCRLEWRPFNKILHGICSHHQLKVTCEGRVW